MKTNYLRHDSSIHELYACVGHSFSHMHPHLQMGRAIHSVACGNADWPNDIGALQLQSRRSEAAD